MLASLCVVSEVRSLRRVGWLDGGARGGRSANSAGFGDWASPDAIRLGKIIYVLLTKTEGKAFSIVHLTPRGAGAEAGRLLHTEYARILWSTSW